MGALPLAAETFLKLEDGPSRVLGSLLHESTNRLVSNSLLDELPDPVVFLVRDAVKLLMKPWIQRNDGTLALRGAQALLGSVPVAMTGSIRVFRGLLGRTLPVPHFTRPSCLLLTELVHTAASVMFLSP